MYLCDTYTIPADLTGDPAMSVPFGTGADDLPVGVQVIAPALDESVMLQVAAALERLQPTGQAGSASTSELGDSLRSPARLPDSKVAR
jgi:Asp-tRNA(Asn)/Glu-tRNA(Gln) amidotransferase A subunit family amidase